MSRGRGREVRSRSNPRLARNAPSRRAAGGGRGESAAYSSPGLFRTRSRSESPPKHEREGRNVGAGGVESADYTIGDLHLTRSRSESPPRKSRYVTEFDRPYSTPTRNRGVGGGPSLYDPLGGLGLGGMGGGSSKAYLTRDAVLNKRDHRRGMGHDNHWQGEEVTGGEEREQPVGPADPLGGMGLGGREENQEAQRENAPDNQHDPLGGMGLNLKIHASPTGSSHNIYNTPRSAEFRNTVIPSPTFPRKTHVEMKRERRARRHAKRDGQKCSTPKATVDEERQNVGNSEDRSKPVENLEADHSDFRRFVNSQRQAEGRSPFQQTYTKNARDDVSRGAETFVSSYCSAKFKDSFLPGNSGDLKMTRRERAQGGVLSENGTGEEPNQAPGSPWTPSWTDGVQEEDDEADEDLGGGGEHKSRDNEVSEPLQNPKGITNETSGSESNHDPTILDTEMEEETFPGRRSPEILTSPANASHMSKLTTDTEVDDTSDSIQGPCEQSVASTTASPRSEGTKEPNSPFVGKENSANEDNPGVEKGADAENDGEQPLGDEMEESSDTPESTSDREEKKTKRSRSQSRSRRKSRSKSKSRKKRSQSKSKRRSKGKSKSKRRSRSKSRRSESRHKTREAEETLSAALPPPGAGYDSDAMGSVSSRQSNRDAIILERTIAAMTAELQKNREQVAALQGQVEAMRVDNTARGLEHNQSPLPPRPSSRSAMPIQHSKEDHVNAQGAGADIPLQSSVEKESALGAMKGKDDDSDPSSRRPGSLGKEDSEEEEKQDVVDGKGRGEDEASTKEGTREDVSCVETPPVPRGRGKDKIKARMRSLSRKRRSSSKKRSDPRSGDDGQSVASDTMASVRSRLSKFLSSPADDSCGEEREARKRQEKKKKKKDKKGKKNKSKDKDQKGTEYDTEGETASLHIKTVSVDVHSKDMPESQPSQNRDRSEQVPSLAQVLQKEDNSDQVPGMAHDQCKELAITIWQDSDTLLLPKEGASASFAKAATSAAAAATIILSQEEKGAMDSTVSIVSGMMMQDVKTEPGASSKMDVHPDAGALVLFKGREARHVSFKQVCETMREYILQEENKKGSSNDAESVEDREKQSSDAATFWARCAIYVAVAVMECPGTSRVQIAQKASETVLCNSNIGCKNEEQPKAGNSWQEQAISEIEFVATEVSVAILTAGGSETMASSATIALLKEQATLLTCEEASKEEAGDTSSYQEAPATPEGMRRWTFGEDTEDTDDSQLNEMGARNEVDANKVNDVGIGNDPAVAESSSSNLERMLVPSNNSSILENLVMQSTSTMMMQLTSSSVTEHILQKSGSSNVKGEGTHYERPLFSQDDDAPLLNQADATSSALSRLNDHPSEQDDVVSQDDEGEQDDVVSHDEEGEQDDVVSQDEEGEQDDFVSQDEEHVPSPQCSENIGSHSEFTDPADDELGAAIQRMVMKSAVPNIPAKWYDSSDISAKQSEITADSGMETVQVVNSPNQQDATSKHDNNHHPDIHDGTNHVAVDVDDKDQGWLELLRLRQAQASIEAMSKESQNSERSQLRKRILGIRKRAANKAIWSAVMKTTSNIAMKGIAEEEVSTEENIEGDNNTIDGGIMEDERVGSGADQQHQTTHHESNQGDLHKEINDIEYENERGGMTTASNDHGDHPEDSEEEPIQIVIPNHSPKLCSDSGDGDLVQTQHASQAEGSNPMLRKSRETSPIPSMGRRAIRSMQSRSSRGSEPVQGHGLNLILSTESADVMTNNESSPFVGIPQVLSGALVCSSSSSTAATSVEEVDLTTGKACIAHNDGELEIFLTEDGKGSVVVSESSWGKEEMEVVSVSYSPKSSSTNDKSSLTNDYGERKTQDPAELQLGIAEYLEEEGGNVGSEEKNANDDENMMRDVTPESITDSEMSSGEEAQQQPLLKHKASTRRSLLKRMFSRKKAPHT